jgi:hypothetical protein
MQLFLLLLSFGGKKKPGNETEDPQSAEEVSCGEARVRVNPAK